MLGHRSKVLDRERLTPEPNVENSGEARLKSFVFPRKVAAESETRERHVELGCDLLQHLRGVVPTQAEVVEEAACRRDPTTTGDTTNDALHLRERRIHANQHDICQRAPATRHCELISQMAL